MPKTNRKLRAFLCHSSNDKLYAKKLYNQLVIDGIDAWLDTEKLIPGQNWQIEIPNAVKNSDVVIVCLSLNSITKEGYVQKEIKIALDTADEKPEETIFIIPARLEICKVPQRIGRYQWVDLFTDNGYRLLLEALQIRANKLGINIKQKNTVDGLPDNETQPEPESSGENEVVQLTRIRMLDNPEWHGPIPPIACLDVWIRYGGSSQLFIDSITLYHIETMLLSAASGTLPPSHRYKFHYERGSVINSELSPPLIITPSDQEEIHFEMEISPKSEVGGWSCVFAFLSARTSNGLAAKIPLFSPLAADLVKSKITRQALIIDIANIFDKYGYFDGLGLRIPPELQKGNNFCQLNPDGSISVSLNKHSYRKQTSDQLDEPIKLNEYVDELISIVQDPTELESIAEAAILLLGHSDNQKVVSLLQEIKSKSLSRRKREAAKYTLEKMEKQNSE